MDIECVVDARAELGEGTVWDPVAQVLWWIDIYGPTIYRFDPASRKNHSWTAPECLGCIGLRQSGGLVLTMASGFHFFEPDTGVFTPIADPEQDIPDTRFNDGKNRPSGAFLVWIDVRSTGQAGRENRCAVPARYRSFRSQGD